MNKQYGVRVRKMLQIKDNKFWQFILVLSEMTLQMSKASMTLLNDDDDVKWIVTYQQLTDSCSIELYFDM